MKEFIEEFKAEAGVIIDGLQGLLMAYEESSAKEHVAEELFRGIHTLKGTAKMFGFDNIEEVTHQLENILDEHRIGKITFTTELIEIVLTTLDYCQQALQMNASAGMQVDLLGRIKNYKIAGSNADDEVKAEVYCILFKPDKDVFERGINIPAILNELGDLGSVCQFEVPGDRSLEQQIAEKSPDVSSFDVWVSTSVIRQDIEDVFMFFNSHEYEIFPVENIDTAITKISNARGIALSVDEKTDRQAFFDTHYQDNSQALQVQEEKENIILSAPESTIQESPARDSKLNYINVSLAKLDQMMKLVSEFVTLTGEVKYYASLFSSEGLQTIAERLEKVSTNFRDNAFDMRLVPIQILSVKLQRYVKDLSQKLGKKVRFITEGMDTEIDKSIINQIEGPLMHIIRNAMDHGIESPVDRVANGKSEEGILKLSAFYSGTNAFIHIQDDGGGIDTDRIRTKAISKGIISASDSLTRQELIDLIFTPGFSTVDTATEISGRGVGMDVVRRNITDLRGSIEVTTEKDLGTSFAIRLPLALSIMDVMIFKVGELNYMVPNSEIDFCTSEKFTDQVMRIGYNLRYNNKLIPFIETRSVFDTNGQAAMDPSILILNKNDQYVSMEVDEIIGKQQVVINPIDETLQVVAYLGGTSILGNGELAFLIDVLKLKELYALEK